MFNTQVRIDNEVVQSGELESDWDFLPPKKIMDPEQKKPEDWEDKATIPDPEDTKPEDWDKPEHIPDPEASKPEDWDDEMDGEWEAPMIDNPDYKVNVFFIIIEFTQVFIFCMKKHLQFACPGIEGCQGKENKILHWVWA